MNFEATLRYIQDISKLLYNATFSAQAVKELQAEYLNLLLNISQSQGVLDQDVALLQAQTLEMLSKLGTMDAKVASTAIAQAALLTSGGGAVDNRMVVSLSNTISTLITSKNNSAFS